MAEPVEKVRIEADGSQASKEAKTVEQRLGEMFDKSALKAIAFNKVIGLGQRALSGMVGVMKDGIKASLEYERTTNMLRTTLAGLGDTGGVWLDTLQKQAAEMERLTGVSDEQIRSFQVMALNSGITTDKVDDLLKAATRLNNSLGGRMGLESAFRNLLKTTSGMRGELNEILPWIQDMTEEQLAAGGAVEYLNTHMETQLEVLTEGRAGAVMGLTTAWANYGEAMGDAATKSGSLVVIADKLTGLLDDMTKIFSTEGFWAGIGALTGSKALRLGGKGLSILEKGRTEDLGLPLEPLVDSGPFGGTKGKGKGKGGGGLGFQMGEGFGGDMVMVGGRFVPRADYEAGIALREEIDTNAATLAQDFTQSQLDYQIGISDMVIADQERVADEKRRIAERSAQEQAAIAQEAMVYVTGVANTALGAFDRYVQATAEGAAHAGDQFAIAMLRGVGKMLQGKGMAHLAEAAAMAFIPGLQGNAAGLAGAGAAELALGTAMAAGGALAAGNLNVQMKSEAEAERNAGGGGAGTFAGGGGGYTSGATPAGEGGNVTIILQGPVYDGAQAGRAIMEKINEAKRQGI